LCQEVQLRNGQQLRFRLKLPTCIGIDHRSSSEQTGFQPSTGGTSSPSASVGDHTLSAEQPRLSSRKRQESVSRASIGPLMGFGMLHTGPQRAHWK
jgi:hypothetical protein